MQHATRNTLKARNFSRAPSFFILFFALLFWIGCENEILSLDKSHSKSTSSAESFQHLAKEISTSDFLRNIEHQNNGENLFAKTKELNMGNVSLRSSLSSIMDSTLLADPLLTLAYPSLDYYPNETVNEHAALGDYVIWLPQDYELTGTIEAYDTTGTLVTIDAVNYDTTARYCIIKHSEEYVAINEGLGETSFGDPIPSSTTLAAIPIEHEVGSWDLYYTQDFYNAFSFDNNFGDDTSVSALEYFNAELDGLRYRLARHNFIAGGFGPAVPRSPCACEDFDWERDCDKDFDVLNRINVGSRKATWKIEHWTDGPRIEFRAIYYVWIRSQASFSEVNVYISGKRHEFHGKWPLVNRTIAIWEKPTAGEPNNMPTKWLEEPKYEDPRPISFSYDGNTVTTQIMPETFEMGDYLIPYSDPYCEGEKYKVWVHINSNMPNDGFFFEERKR
jgi:hypothetical protein